ncbi:MAG: nucleoside monophosphate kinase [Candidatus Yonathbacteria bacterium]|nr:nucleoside monophosphate kinase [Candidatus Yonathbacteria bacterium]
MNITPQTVIFIGRSGAGKGIQSKLLQNFLKDSTPDIPVLYLETGACFREYIKREGYTWNRARVTTETGLRQPNFLAIWSWSQFFIDNIKGDNQHLILDGISRALNEAEALSTAFLFYHRKNPIVVFLDISNSCAERRLRLRGRSDDLIVESIASKQKWFEEDVVPAVEYYRNNPDYNFLEIDGEQAPERIHQEIMKKLLGVSGKGVMC